MAAQRTTEEEVMMPNVWLVIWCDPELEEEVPRIQERLRWTREKRAEVMQVGPNAFAWSLGVPLSSGMLADIVGSLHQEPESSWALALVSEPDRIPLGILPRLSGQVVLDERITGNALDLHWDHPLGPQLREMHLGLWRRADGRRDEPVDPSESLRRMRNVPRSPNHLLAPQQIRVSLPPGKSPADYAAIAYADVPDGSEQYNGVGGRNVLLFHSAMKCRHPPFEPHGGDHPAVFVFLNAPAVGVRHYSTVRVPNNLIDHLLTKKIVVERVIGGPKGDVRHRPDVTKRYG
jgi:hypothetical protein